METGRSICMLLVAVFMAAAASPALACKGNQDLLHDFSGPWVNNFPDTTTADITKDKVTVTSQPGKLALVSFEGGFFPEADACVDITMAKGSPETVQAGWLLMSQKTYDLVLLFSDGSVGVDMRTPEGELRPVPQKKVDAFKPEGANTLRVVWGDEPKAQVFVNDQLEGEFPFPKEGRKIAVIAGTEGDNPAQFTNLSVTK
jgi:hypothetical protein